MVIHFMNISEADKALLREFESQHFDEVMLVISPNAFDGVEEIKLILEAAIGAATVIELILKIRKGMEGLQNKQKVTDEKHAAAKKASMEIVFSDGSSYRREIEDVSEAGLKTFFETGLK